MQTTSTLPAISFVKNFIDVDLNDTSFVGGKNASLGEMLRHLPAHGIRIPEGFAITSSAYWEFLDANNLRYELESVLGKLDRKYFSNLPEIGKEARELLLSAKLPCSLEESILESYEELCFHAGKNISVAVRSSAAAGDLVTESFAGQFNSYLNISGAENLLHAVLQCFASLFNDRAIKYREASGFDHLSFAMSVGVQRMVRADLGCAGVAFTHEPVSEFENVILITGSWGLDENAVEGGVDPDEFYVFKPSLKNKKYPIIQKKIGSRVKTTIDSVNVDMQEEKREQWVLSDDEVRQIAEWSLMIEEHFGQVMEVEWAKDGITNELFILQARPEAIHSTKQKVFTEDKLKEKGKTMAEGAGTGSSNITLPDTQVMMILGDPEKAFHYSFYPNNGIGLLGLEFIINNIIQIHRMALVKFNALKDENAKKKIEELTKHYPDKEKYFIDKLSQAVATIAAAFYPKDVVVRMSDFKTNEYANLIGGKEFEPHEENPMLGFRGASRYCSDYYREGFRLECEAMKRVREEMGLTNVKLMIPFCRTAEEGKKVIAQMEQFGLKRGETPDTTGAGGLEIYLMAETPANVFCAEEYAEIFDGFSIGSNVLSQLILGIDRDSALVSNLFDERNPAVKNMIAMMIALAKESNSKIGLCGDAPGDFPEFAQFLVQQGIDSISFNPDALIKGIESIQKAEEKMNGKRLQGGSFRKSTTT